MKHRHNWHFSCYSFSQVFSNYNFLRVDVLHVHFRVSIPQRCSLCLVVGAFDASLSSAAVVLTKMPTIAGIQARKGSDEAVSVQRGSAFLSFVAVTSFAP